MDLNSQSWLNSVSVLFSEIFSTNWTQSVCAKKGQLRMGSVDAKKLTAQVAARHGLLIREDDPAMALVTMSEMVLEQVPGKGGGWTTRHPGGGRKRAEKVATGSCGLGSRRNRTRRWWD
jgi:hypothetical protein